jgi:hypothetical protein
MAAVAAAAVAADEAAAAAEDVVVAGAAAVAAPAACPGVPAGGARPACLPRHEVLPDRAGRVMPARWGRITSDLCAVRDAAALIYGQRCA